MSGAAAPTGGNMQYSFSGFFAFEPRRRSAVKYPPFIEQAWRGGPAEQAPSHAGRGGQAKLASCDVDTIRRFAGRRLPLPLRMVVCGMLRRRGLQWRKSQV